VEHIHTEEVAPFGPAHQSSHNHDGVAAKVPFSWNDLPHPANRSHEYQKFSEVHETTSSFLEFLAAMGTHAHFQCRQCLVCWYTVDERWF
jgi:hypothetical protein